ncbi:MAG: alpha/beta fold hydrolase [Gammaproteobacteria bacterium]|nr:alpha/beta fold hydrolase [Gammaproteobacteria bacterium]MDH3447792.1 alpha/beta fold hydrolase [Gammaproteobacteria bacterium]
MPETSRNGSVYELSGPGDASTVVFVHGLGLNRHVWEKYVPQFAHRFQVLNYDLFGHGDSVAPPSPTSLTTFSEQLLDLLDELGIEQCSIIGFSLGGMINRRFAMDHPRRLRALAILNSPHERDPEAQKLVEQRALDSAAGGPGATLDATIERWFTPWFIEANPEYIATVRGWVLANDPEIYARCRRVLAFGVIELIRPQPPITHPTLVITCENDSGSTPEMSQAIAGEIAGAQVVVVPELQHMGLVENPSFFINALADFLEDI